MKTTIEIPEKVLREAMRHTRARTKQAAVLAAILDFNRRHRLRRLTRRFGTFEGFLSHHELAALRGDERAASNTGASLRSDG